MIMIVLLDLDAPGITCGLTVLCPSNMGLSSSCNGGMLFRFLSEAKER
jgi:hypothetical protein